MLITFFSWIIIGFILLSFGDMLLTLFNKVCKHTGNYNLIDKLIVGLCAIIIPLSIWSLWLPSNHVFLLISFIANITYWFIFRKRAYNTFTDIKQAIASLSKMQLLVLVALVLSSVFLFSWEQEVYDSLLYHHQNIRWNEEFAIVPGLANLDDKFGFNSNYFLLSSIFTFRFVVGEAIYSLQSFIVTAISSWIFYEVFKSKYEIKRIIIFISYILFFWVSIQFLRNTSSDVIPNFIAFYLIVRIVLHPQLLKTNNVLYILLPVFLLTCKLSFFPVCIISLYLLYKLIKEKQYKGISIVCTICALIVIPWLIRNVIISGYLIYPLYQIDLFSFDWKVPKEVAIKQKIYIFDVGYQFLRITLRYPNMILRDPLYINILAEIIYLLTLVSMSIMTYHLIKRKKKVREHIWLLYSVFLLSILVWGTGGPDIRFIAGILCAVIFSGGILLLKDRYLPLIGKISALLFVAGIFIWNSYQFYDFYKQTRKSEMFLHAIYKPYTMKDQKKAQGRDVSENFTSYSLNNGVSILVNSDLLYDVFPSTVYDIYAKFLPIGCLEARGTSLQDGFRAKEICR